MVAISCEVRTWGEAVEGVSDSLEPLWQRFQFLPLLSQVLEQKRMKAPLCLEIGGKPAVLLLNM